MNTLGRTGRRRPVAAAFTSLATLATAALLAMGVSTAHADSVKAARYYEDALKRFERQDIDGAVIQLKNALQQDARMLTVHVLLGKALLMRSEAAAAEIEFNEALSQGINRAEVAVPLAQALVAQGKQAEVFKQPALVPDGLPDNIRKSLLLVRAAAASDLGDPTRAQAQIDLARAIPPDNADSWLAEVPLRLRARQFDKATAAADQALRLAPNNGEALYQRATVPHVQGKQDEALKGYERAIAADPRHIEAQLARAGLLIDLNRDAEALTQVQSALKLAPAEPRALYLTAVLAERRKDGAAAKAALKAVTTALDPVPIEFIRYRPQALMLNGLAHFGLGEMEKAKPYLEYAQRVTPNSPLSKLLAQVYMAEPNLDRAAEVLEAYLKAYPGDGQALVMLATLQMAQGRHARATALMQEALKAKDAPEFRTALGLSLLRSGQSSDAVGELEKSFQRDPRQTYAGMALVTLYLRGGQTAKAVAVADQLVKQAPTSPSAWIQLGLARRTAGNAAGAREAYQKANQLDPLLIEPQLGLVRIDISQRQFDAAQARLDAMLKVDEKNADALYEMALLSEARGQTADVQRWLSKAADVSGSRNTRADQALVAWMLRQDQPGPALEAAKRLLAKAPDDPQALITYAKAQFANRDLTGARSTLTNAARRAGFGADVLAQIAALQLDARDFDGAAYSLDKALQTSPQHVAALGLSSTVALQQGNLALAEKQARQVVQLRPQAAVGYTLLADVAQARKQPSQAVDSLRKAHEVQPTSGSLLTLMRALSRQDPTGRASQDLADRWLKTHANDIAVWKALGDAQARASDFRSARRSYEAALKLRPNDVEALNNLANAMIRQGEPAVAATTAEKALSLDPRNAAVIDTAGWAHHLAGNPDRALQLLRDARLREPSSPDIRYHLAAVLAKAGRKSEAKEEIDVALRSTAFESHKEALALSQTLR
ncbi:XrtA/PEP-CTERM system TPR-repeat protein PrsT [Roseateles sp. L2-2]|uniref:XrtA/PEP-CTERM system TPR-repeat protein PrsT n=1 Tax=Roseateles TaxID=93681 RepID=UPI003D369959